MALSGASRAQRVSARMGTPTSSADNSNATAADVSASRTDRRRPTIRASCHFEIYTRQLIEDRHQIAKDSHVINHEAVNYGEGDVEYVSIYEVRNGLIQTVSFVRDR